MKSVRCDTSKADIPECKGVLAEAESVRTEARTGGKAGFWGKTCGQPVGYGRPISESRLSDGYEGYGNPHYGGHGSCRGFDVPECGRRGYPDPVMSDAYYYGEYGATDYSSSFLSGIRHYGSDSQLHEDCGRSVSTGCPPIPEGNPFDGSRPMAYDYGMDVMSDNASERKMQSAMSFVGVGYFMEKIIAFADRRSSAIVNGTLALDEKHPDTAKLWKSDDFVSVFCGTNSFVAVRDENSTSAKTIYLERWLRRNFSGCASPDELCEKLYGYILRHSMENFGRICVISAKRKSGCVYFSEADICLHSFSMNTWNQADWGFHINGDGFHKQYFSEHSNKFLTLDEAVLQSRLEGINTEYAKAFPGRYDPVGSRWDIRIF